MDEEKKEISVILVEGKRWAYTDKINKLKFKIGKGQIKKCPYAVFVASNGRLAKATVKKEKKPTNIKKEVIENEHTE